MMNLGAPLRFPKNDLGIPPRSFTYSGQPNPLQGFAPRLYRGGMLAVGHDFQPGAHASIVPGGAFQAGKFTGTEPTPGGPEQQGAAAAGAGPGAEGEGPTPGGGIVSAVDQAFNAAKQIVGAAKALTTSAPTTTTAPSAARETTGTAEPVTQPTPPAPAPDLSKPETISSGLETMETPASAVQAAPVSGLEQMPPASMPPKDVLEPSTTVASRLGGPMNLGTPPVVPQVSPTEAVPGQQKEEIPPLGAAGATAAGAGIAPGTFAPGAPAPAQAGASTIGSTAGPATPTAPQGPAPSGVASVGELPAGTQPGPTGTEAPVNAPTSEPSGPSGTDTAISGAGGALNLGSGVFDLIRGNVPAGLKEAISGAGQLGTTAARALAPGTANVIGNVAGAARGIEGAIDVGNAIAGAPGESTGQRVLQGVGGATTLASKLPEIANVVDAAVGTNLGTAAGGALAPGTTAGNIAGDVGQVAPYVGTALSIAQNAMGNAPDWEKAADSAVDAAALALSVETGGISMLAAPVVKTIIGELDGRPSEAWAGFPSQVGTDWKAREGAMGTLAKNIQAAQSPQELQTAIKAYRQSIMTDGGVGPDSPVWAGYNYSNPAVDVAKLHKDYLAAHPEYTPPQPRYVGDRMPTPPWLAGLSIIPGSTGAWAPEGYAFNPSPGDMLNQDPYAIPTLPDWPGSNIHGQHMPSTNGFFAKGTDLLKNAIAGKLARLQNPAPPPAPPAPPAPVQAAAPVNLGGPGPLPGASNTPGINTALTERAPGVNLGTPGVNTALTAEQQRALMFQVA